MARVFSGIQPSGELHIGNYLGAVQNWVTAGPARVHFLDRRSARDHAALRTRGSPSARSMGIGCSPPASIPPHDPVRAVARREARARLILTTVTPLGELERQTQYKDKAQRQEASRRLLNYPILQAADAVVPGGPGAGGEDRAAAPRA
jgi:tryptophanyl-tRNA synthetase